MSNELPPLPDDIEQAIYERSLRFVPQTVHRAIEQLMREYGKACERAAYERAVKKCEEFEDELQTKGRDREADVALGLARRIERLGADK